MAKVADKDSFQASGWTPLASAINKASDINNYEKSRITNAVYFLSDKQLIDNKTNEDVISLAEEMNQLRSDHFEEIYETKKQELEEAKNNIDQQASDWKEQRKE